MMILEKNGKEIQMRHVLGIVATLVYRFAFFVLVFVFSAFATAIILCLFYGVASMSLIQFGILPQTPKTFDEMWGLQTIVYIVMLGLAGLGGIYIAVIAVNYTYHKDVNRLNRDLGFATLPIFWMTHATLTGFLFSFAVILFYSFWNGRGASGSVITKDFSVEMHDARFALLAVFIYACIRATDKIYKRA